MAEGIIPALHALGEREEVHSVANDAMRIREALEIQETRTADWQVDALDASIYVYPGSTIGLFAEAFEMLENKRNSVPDRIRAGTCALVVASALYIRKDSLKPTQHSSLCLTITTRPPTQSRLSSSFTSLRPENSTREFPQGANSFDCLETSDH